MDTAGVALHTVRQNYGWTDEYILEHVELYGIAWLIDNYKLCQVGFQQNVRMLSTLMPLARTPQDRKSGASMKKFSKDLSKMIENLAPWTKREAYEKKRKKMKASGKTGGITVHLSGAEASHPLFKDE